MPFLRDIQNDKLVVSTLKGKSYYNITKFLKYNNLNYESLSPIEALESNAKIILTSREESMFFLNKQNIQIINDTELNKEPVVIKAKIVKKIMEKMICDDQLTIGIDPGNRIGIAVYYFHQEIESIVLSSIESVIRFLMIILEEISSCRKIVRIGDGDINMARNLAEFIKFKFKRLVHIEIVNESGSSISSSIEVNRRIIRDKSSAKIIAFRNGKTFEIP